MFYIMSKHLQDLTQTIIAIGLTLAMIYLMISGIEVKPEFLTIYAGIISFYFASKGGNGGGNGNGTVTKIPVTVSAHPEEWLPGTNRP
jgi:hypothetical protein